jgi:hypothetical protein
VVGSVTSEDVVAEGERLAVAAEAEGLALRLLGGVAIAITCPSARTAPLKRSYGDIDMIARGRDRRGLQRFLVSHGYQGVEQLNAVHGKSRLFFYDPARGRRLDVFLDRFEMCHDLDLRRRIELAGPTLPLADLLLTKLQVFETTEKDLGDIVAVLSDHDLSTDEEGINVVYLAELTGSDWGLWKTVTLVAGGAQTFASRGGHHTAAERAGRLVASLEQAPKSRTWTLRDRIGERVRWYKLPEEPDFG